MVTGAYQQVEHWNPMWCVMVQGKRKTRWFLVTRTPGVAYELCRMGGPDLQENGCDVKLEYCTRSTLMRYWRLVERVLEPALVVKEGE